MWIMDVKVTKRVAGKSGDREIRNRGNLFKYNRLDSLNGTKWGIQLSVNMTGRVFLYL
jgi:hypothetical protein